MSSFCSYIEGTWGGCSGMLLFSVLGALPLIVLGVLSARRTARPDFLALMKLNALGVDLTQPRDLRFTFFFRTRASADHIASKLGDAYSCAIEEGNVTVQVAGENEPRGETGFLLHAERRMIPDGDELTRLRATFTSAAQSENGQYLGWQTSTRLVGA